MLMPAYLGYPGTDEGWSAQVKAASTGQLRAYGEFLGNRYRSDPNIIWAMGGDKNPDAEERPRMEALAAGLRATAPNHLMTAHTVTNNNADEVWGSSDWLDLNNVYTYGAPADRTAAAYGASPTRPVFFIEGIYENEQGADDSLIRNQAWASLLSGASGQIFGNNPIWHFDTGGLYPAPGTWQQALDSRGSVDMSHLRNLFDTIPWQRLTPDRADRFLVGGEQSGSNRAAASISAGDGLGLVYVPSARTVEIDLGRLSSDSVVARWFDPTRGTYRDIGTFAGTGRRSFTTPGANSVGDRDWVLVLADPATAPGDWFSPARLLDSRSGQPTIDGKFAGIGRRPAGSITSVDVAGRGGVDTNAGTAILNVAIVDPSGNGYATVFPCGAPVPTAASVNYRPGVVTSNAVVAELGTNGKVCIYTRTAIHLVIDVSGVFPASSQYDGFSPARLLDSRSGQPTIDGKFAGIGRRPAGSITSVDVAGRGGVDTNAGTAILNVAIVDPSGNGYATVFPCGAPVPTAASVNYRPGVVTSNAVVAELGTNGKVCIYTRTAIHLVIDVSGVFPASSQYDGFSPARLLDSRQRTTHHRRQVRRHRTPPRRLDHLRRRRRTRRRRHQRRHRHLERSRSSTPPATATPPCSPAAHPSPPPPASTTDPASSPPTPSSPNSAPTARSASTPAPPSTSSSTSAAICRSADQDRGSRGETAPSH